MLSAIVLLIFIVIVGAICIIAPKAIRKAKETTRKAKEVQDAWEQAKSELGKDDAEMAKSIFKKLAE